MTPERIIAARVNGIGRHGGCACCNVPGRRLRGYSHRVRTAVRRFAARDVAAALDDVPTPEEVDPMLRARATCEGVDCTCAEAGYLDNYEPRRAVD